MNECWSESESDSNPYGLCYVRTKNIILGIFICVVLQKHDKKGQFL